jgi:hypothetical protein
MNPDSMSTKPVPSDGVSIQKAQTIPLIARVMGLYLLAARGSGKSTLAALIAFQDFIRHIPQVIIDPLGGTIDSLLWRITSFLEHVPPEMHGYFWNRIRYVDMSGKTGFISPFPLYYRTGSETSLREVAERYLQVIRLSTPALTERPIMGWPPLRKIGTYSGMILAALGYQITEALDLLRNPAAWQARLTRAQEQYPELSEAVAFFREYISMRPAAKERLTTSFIDHIFGFTLDSHMKAMFGAPKPGISWEAVEENGHTVLLDFRHVHDPELRRFSLLWVFNYLYEHIKARGRRDTPLGLIVDEFAALAHKVTAGENPLATLLDAFINQYMRQHNIFLTVAHQDIFQLDEQLQNTLLSLGTCVFGRTSTMAAARLLADSLTLTDPKKVKHHRKVWGRNDPPPPGYSGRSRDLPLYFVLDTEPEFYPLPEQLEIAAQRIKKLGLFQFLLRPALGEGEVSSAVIPINIRSVVRDTETGLYRFPDQAVVTRLRSLLAAKSGIPIGQLLAEQENRLRPAPPKLPLQPDQAVTRLPVNRRKRRR